MVSELGQLLMPYLTEQLTELLLVNLNLCRIKSFWHNMDYV